MNITKYELLLAIAQFNSIKEAAEEMNYSPSGVSHMMDSLEEELGKKVLIRGRNGTKLTSEGEAILPYIRQVVKKQRELEAALGQIRGETPKSFSMGSFISTLPVYLPELFRGFKRRFPDTDLLIRSGSLWDINNWLDRREIEVGFVILTEKIPWEEMPLCRDDVVVVCGEEYRPQSNWGETVSQDEVAQERVISIGDPMGKRDLSWVFPNFPKMDFDFCIQDVYAQMDLVRENFGVALSLRKVAERFPGIRVYELEGSPKATMGLVYRGEEERSPAVQELLEIAKSTLIG